MVAANDHRMVNKLVIMAGYKLVNNLMVAYKLA